MSRTINIYNTINANKLRTLIDSVFTISWGDGIIEDLNMPTVYDTNLPYAQHEYSADGDYEVEITVNSPWKVEKLKRTITIPIINQEFPTGLGRLCFTVPYTNPGYYQSQNYLEDYMSLTGDTNSAPISFLAVGKSRIDEFKMYGSSEYSGVTEFYTEQGYLVTGYTIGGLYYMDYADGYTHITGNTQSYYNEETYSEFYQDEVYQGMITRDEHLIGFLDIPQISSDIFVERGRQGVMERNLRLGEIDSTGELSIYGNGYFTIRKQ
jgi:hypothetical protein